MLRTFERKRLPPPPPGGRVVTLGVFDGVHVGHAAILDRTIASARARGAGSAVITFRRHPRRLLAGSEPPTITSLEHRLLLFERRGVDLALALPFDAELRETTAESFLDVLLRAELGAVALVFGHDARFGKDRRGDAAFARERGWPVEVVPAVMVNGVRASSGAVRAAIAEGRLGDAASLLGRAPSLLGTVVRGDGRGRSLGFATANLDLHHELRPPRGVYAGACEIDGVDRAAVVNVGVRPTVDGSGVETVEAHVPGWTDDLYGRHLEVRLIERLRGEQRFPDVGALRAQIARDAARALELFETRPRA